jgi:hypothetical protein
MTDVVAAARARLAELKQEIETLEDFLNAAAKVSVLLNGHAVWHSSMQELAPEPEAQAAEAQVRRAKGKRGDFPPNPKAEVIIPATIKLLREVGQPLGRRAIRERLAGRGLVVNGTDAIKAMGTILWRARDQLTYVDGRGYWPVGDRVPPEPNISQMSLDDL